MKRKLSLILVGVMLLVSMVGCGSQDSGSGDEVRELVVSTWGFNEDVLRKNVYEPFEKEHNVKIVLDVGNNGDRLNKIRTMGENAGIDIIFLAESFAIQGIEEGIFEEINRENIPNLENIYELARAPHGENYGPAYTLNRTGIIYNEAEVDFEINSWEDLWNEALNNNISIPEITTTAGPAMVVAAGKVAGVDALSNTEAAFDKLAEIRPNLVKTYGLSSELVNMFTQGEIVAGVAQDFAYGNILAAVPSVKWVNPSEGAFANLNTINIVKGSENIDLAELFIDWMLSEEVQLANALDGIDSPVNVNVELTEEEAEGLTYGKDLIDSLIVIDGMKVNELKAQWIDTWNREILN